MPDGNFELTVAAASDQYDPAHEGWRGQANDLYLLLRAEAEATRIQSTTVPGTKGSIDTLILALGSAGAFSALVTCFKAWLGRGKNRRIELSWTQDDRTEHLTITGEGIDDASMQRLSEAIGVRIGGGTWPASTERS